MAETADRKLIGKSRQQSEARRQARTALSFRFLLCGLLVMLTIVVRVWSQQSTSPAAGVPARITILYLNDVHQFTAIEGGTRGSLARVSTIVKLIRKESPNTIFVLAGNTLSPSRESVTDEGRQMINAWNAAGLDLAVIGNQDFAFGTKVLQQRIKESRFRWLGANILEGGKTLDGVSPTTIFSFAQSRAGNLSVAFLGLVGPKSIPDAVGNVSFSDPNEAAPALLQGMRVSGVKVFIALTNMSLQDDQELARRVPDLALIIGGRSDAITKVISGRTPIFKTSGEARELGRLDLNFDPIRGDLLSIDSTIIPVTSQIPDDPQFALLGANYLKPESPVGASPCVDKPPANPSSCEH